MPTTFELNDSIRQEQDEKVTSGEFDQMDSDSFREVSNGDSVNVKPKRMAQSANLGKSYVRRGPNTFVAANSVRLIPGEPLYRYRKRGFGITEKYIKYGKAK